MLNFRKARKKSIVEAVQITEKILKKNVGKTLLGADDTIVLFKENGFSVITKEGLMEGKVGDYLMKGVNGEFYPCDKEIFEKSYEWVK